MLVLFLADINKFSLGRFICFLQWSGDPMFKLHTMKSCERTRGLVCILLFQTVWKIYGGSGTRRNKRSHHEVNGDDVCYREF
jgi:hypothetical protein